MMSARSGGEWRAEQLGQAGKGQSPHQSKPLLNPLLCRCQRLYGAAHVFFFYEKKKSFKKTKKEVFV